MNCLTKLGLVALLAVVAVGSGCSKKPKNITPIPNGYNAFNPSSAPTTDLTGGNAIRPTTGPGVGNTLRQPADPNPRDLNPTTTDKTNPDGTALPPGDIRDGMVVDHEMFKGNTVYFEYDKSAIKSAEYAKVAAVAEYLKSHGETKIVVEGHCDERGTEEYNRALSERRALAVRERMVNLGVSADRITTEPWGEDKPADPGHDEAAWAKNRRAEFLLLVPPSFK
jgi:peptidoglycan-associated lipoprotein